MILAGVPPVEVKPNYQLEEGSPNSLGTIGREWLEKQLWVPKHKANVTRQIEQDIFHYLGARPIRAVTRQEIYTALQRIEDREALDVAKRTARHCVQIFDYAMLKA